MKKNGRQILDRFFITSSPRVPASSAFTKKKESVSEPNRFRPNFFLSVCQSASDRKKSFLKASIIAISPTILVPPMCKARRYENTCLSLVFYQIPFNLSIYAMCTKFVSLYRERILRSKFGKFDFEIIYIEIQIYLVFMQIYTRVKLVAY